MRVIRNTHVCIYRDTTGTQVSGRSACQGILYQYTHPIKPCNYSSQVWIQCFHLPSNVDIYNVLVRVLVLACLLTYLLITRLPRRYSRTWRYGSNGAAGGRSACIELRIK